MDQQDFLGAYTFPLGYDGYDHSKSEVLTECLKRSNIKFLPSDNSYRALLFQLNDQADRIYSAASTADWEGNFVPWEPGVNFQLDMLMLTN